jgi:DNA-binding NtrC family response regulator
VRVLVVDDDAGIRGVLRRILKKVPEMIVDESATVEEAKTALRLRTPHLVLLDVRLRPGSNEREGVTVLRHVREHFPGIPVVMVTSSTNLADVREAMRLGARDYVIKDELSTEMLLPIVEGFRERLRLDGEIARLRERVTDAWGVSAIVGSSPAMRAVRATIQRVADSGASVLVRGETGTGKELVARALHVQSARRDQPFVVVNCAALPAALVESTLFGRASNTPGDPRIPGQLESAGAGTILLDEVSELPLELQAALVRVLEDRKIRLPGGEEIPLQARMVSATHQDLEKRMAESRFRRDLFYRLAVVDLALPPLLERVGDLPDLLVAFADGAPRRISFAESAIAWMRKRRWDGNVRELRNLVDRVLILTDDEVATEATMRRVSFERASDDEAAEVRRCVQLVLAMPSSAGSKFSVFERALIERALAAAAGNKSAAARLLGVERKSLERRIERVLHPRPDDGD